MTGEGIGQALATGAWAAEAILSAGSGSVDGDPLAVARRYETTVRREMIADHRFGRRLGNVLASAPAPRPPSPSAASPPGPAATSPAGCSRTTPGHRAHPRRWSRTAFASDGAYIGR